MHHQVVCWLGTVSLSLLVLFYVYFTVGQFHRYNSEKLLGPKSHYYEWHIREAISNPDGIGKKTVLQINGQMPGPTIHSVVGDRININIHNHLESSTSFHWHGIKQRGTNHMDGTAGITECGIIPSGNFTYSFTVDEPGTYWYHSHHHLQRMEGLLGALIVYESASIKRSPVVLLQDWYHDDVHKIYHHYMSRSSGGYEPVPDNGLINGQNEFLQHYGKLASLGILQNSGPLDIRLINGAAFADFLFSIDGHELEMLEADGVAVQPHTVHYVPISPGQRYKIRIRPHSPAYVRAVMDLDQFRYIPSHLNEEVLAILGNPESIPEPRDIVDAKAVKGKHYDVLVPSDLVPMHQDNIYSPPMSADISLKVSIQTMKLEQVDLAPFAFFNRTTFTPAIGAPNLHVALNHVNADETLPVPTVSAPSHKYGGSQLVVDIPYNSIVELIVENPDDSDHPLHLHGHDFWIMHTKQAVRGLGGWDERYRQDFSRTPMRRDTHTVPRQGHTVLRWRANNPGIWAFHCHNEWHHAAGLMMQFAEGMAEFHEDIPQAQLDQCNYFRQRARKLIEPLPNAKNRQYY